MGVSRWESRILDSLTVRMMRTPWFTGSPGGSSEDQGLIWYTQSFGGRKLWGHTGGTKGVTTAMFLSEDYSTGILFLMNFSSDQFPWETVVERLMTAADALIVRRATGLRNHSGTVPTSAELPEPLQPHDDNPLRSAHVEVPLSIFNTLGQQVAQIVNGDMDAGYHEVRLDAQESSGVYFYRIQPGAIRYKENADSEMICCSIWDSACRRVYHPDRRPPSPARSK